MALLVESYSFADFAKHWAKELERDPNEIASVLAKAILKSELEYHTHDPRDPGPSHHQDVPYSENIGWQEFDAALNDHFHLIVRGTDAADFDDRLRYVTLDRSEVAKWLASVGAQLPLFWRDLVTDQRVGQEPEAPVPTEPGAREYRTLQKILAVLTLTLADEHKKFRRKDAIVLLQVFQAISDRLDDDPHFTTRLRVGLARSTVIEHIKRALAVFDDEPEDSSDEA